MSAKTAKNKTKLIGLTGGIATGKTTTCNYLKERGFLVFDSDLYVAKLWRENKSLIDYVKQKYQIDMTTSNGKKALADLIFNNPEKRTEIELLIHPFVFEGLNQWVKAHSDAKILFLDIPLLFEIGYEDKVDATILVYTKKELQIERLIKRNNYTKEEALKRINSQMDLDEKLAKATYVLNNNDTIISLYTKIDQLLEEIINEN